MRFIILFSILVFISGCSTNKVSDNLKTSGNKMENVNISNVSVKKMNGEEILLSEYNGKVLLIVNVASKCGSTPQYSGLETIYGKYKDKGFEVLAFPSNDFGGQEPGTNEEIKEFCETNYNVTFPLFDKLKVLGDDKSALYAELIKTEPSGDVAWNFEKFLADKDGNVVARFGTKVQPESDEITDAIEEQLQK